MAFAITGLNIKPTYEDLLGCAYSDGLEQIQFFSRNATFIREGFVLSQLDGEGIRAMERQQQMHIKEPSQRKHIKTGCCYQKG